MHHYRKQARSIICMRCQRNCNLHHEPWYPMKRFALASIRFYRRSISPNLPPSCRFQPSCSEYAYEAIEKYGIIKGGRLAIWRILRCNPFGGKGWDPVP